MTGLELSVNGQSRLVTPESTVAELLELLGIDPSGGGVAVAVNGAVVPKLGWATAKLSDGDAVEVIHAVQGG